MPERAAVATTNDAVYLFGGATHQNQALDQLLKISIKPGTEENDWVRVQIIYVYMYLITMNKVFMKIQ